MIQRTYTNFAGGQNNNAGEYASPVIEDAGDVEALMFAEMSYNWDMAENGLIKYPGDDDVLSSALSGTPAITGLYDWKGTFIMTAGTKVYTVSGGAPTQIYTGVTAGKFFTFTEWDNGSGTEILIMCNGEDTPLYYDGTTCTTITFTDPGTIWNSAKPKGASVFRGRVFYWGDKTKTHRVYTPRPGTHNNFDNSTSEVDAFDVEAGFGGKLTGIKALTDDFLVIYKERCIRRLVGTEPFGSTVDPFELRNVTNEFGCIAPRTIIGNDIEHYFMAEDGLRQLKPIFSYGDIDPNQPTYPIQDLMNTLNYTTAAIQDSCAVFHKPSRQIWLSVPYGASSTNNKIIHFDVITRGNAPRKTDDIKAASLAVFNRKVYHGSYAGQIYKHGDNNDFHGGINNAQWESKYIAHGGIGLRKIYRELRIVAESDGVGDLIAQWNVMKANNTFSGASTQNVSTSSSLWGSMVWGVDTWGGSSISVLKIKNLGRGNALKLKFINNSTTQRIKIRQVDMFFDILGTAKG